MLSFFKPFKNGRLPAKIAFFIYIPLLLCFSYAQPPVRIPDAARQSLNSECRTLNVKLLFLCRNALWYVDFSENSPQLRTINQMDSAYFPVISPDGKWLAYQTENRFEGPPAPATPGKIWFRELAVDGTPVKVADTGFFPRFIQNAPADEPEILYSTSIACPGDGMCYNDGKTVKKKILNKTPQTAHIVYSAGSYYGGLSWDNRYLNTAWPGGPNAFILDLQNSTTGPRPVHTMHVKKIDTDIDTFVELTSCNSSASASLFFPDNMLYVDFSSQEIKDVGCYHPILGEWGIHGKLIISRYDAEDLRVFDMPADRPLIPPEKAMGNGEAISGAWEFPEWSNHPYYAISSLLTERIFAVNGSMEHTYNCESIYLIDLKDSSYIKIIESTDTSRTSKTDLTYPFLWVEKTRDFKEDTTWLKSTIWQRAAQGVIPHRREQPQNDDWRSFIKDNTVTAISVYSILGRRVGTIKPSFTGRSFREKAFNYPSTGIFLLRNDSKERAGKTSRVISWR